MALANAARLGVRWGAMCADAVRSLNANLKRAYNDHRARSGGGGGGGMPGTTSLEWEGEVVLQIWEWSFLKCTSHANTMGPPRRPQEPWPNGWLPKEPRPPPFSHLPQLVHHPFMDAASMQCMLEGTFKSQEECLVCLYCLFVCCRLC